MQDNEVGQFVDWVIGDIPESKDKYVIEGWLYTKVLEWYNTEQSKELTTNE